MPETPVTSSSAPADVVDRGDAWAVVGAGPHGLSALKALRRTLESYDERE